MVPDEASPRSVVVAFFDVDGTLAKSNLIDAYMDFALHGKNWAYKGLWFLKFFPKLPFYAILDWFDRVRFNEVFFNNYKNESIDTINAWACEWGDHYWSARIYKNAFDEISWHRSKGHKIAFVTGALSDVVKPLAKRMKVDAIACTHPEVIDGRLTGHLTSKPISGPNKAGAVKALAIELGADLRECYAYADDISDRQFLECVGYPIVINPDRRLRNIAHDKGWPIQWWRTFANMNPIDDISSNDT